jgi:hypothetical protein
MILRRITRLVVLAFIAGPALTLDCIVSCAMKDGAEPQKCHGTATSGVALQNHDGCDDVETHVAPFVKSDGLKTVAWIVPASVFAGVRAPVAATPFPTFVPDPGPPDRLAVIPLRI